jgi:hypothetical protein
MSVMEVQNLPHPGIMIEEPRWGAGEMVVLSEATWEKVRELFPPEQHEAVARILETECGNNVPFSEKETSYGLERLRFAALKLSKGNMENLCSAVNLAKRDWRDLLVAAGFAHSIDAHKRWVIR